jgi:hypothetical protein
MKKFNVDVDLGMSGFNIHVDAEDYVGAMVAAMQELNKRGFEDEKIESLNLSLII